MNTRIVRLQSLSTPPARSAEARGACASRVAARVAGVLCASLLVTACGTVEWVKTRFVEPGASAPAAQPGASSQQSTPQPAVAAAPAPATREPAPPPVSQRAPLPPATQAIAQTTPQQPAPLAPPPAPVAPVAPPPAPQPAAKPSPAPRAALAAAPAASGELTAGRWAVQVGVFHVANSAEAVRARVAAQLEPTDIPAAGRATRVVRRDNKYFVVVGDAADRASAEALADRLRAALKQDVVLFRR